MSPAVIVQEEVAEPSNEETSELFSQTLCEWPCQVGQRFIGYSERLDILHNEIKDIKNVLFLCSTAKRPPQGPLHFQQHYNIHRFLKLQAFQV